MGTEDILAIGAIVVAIIIAIGIVIKSLDPYLMLSSWYLKMATLLSPRPREGEKHIPTPVPILSRLLNSNRENARIYFFRVMLTLHKIDPPAKKERAPKPTFGGRSRLC